MSEKLLRMEAIMRGENPLERNRALLDLIDKLGPGDFEDVVAQFRALGITQSRMGEYTLLLSAWAKADPMAALEYAQEKTQGAFASTTILATWATTDPDAALRWAEANHEGEGPNPYLIGIIRGLAETDPARATSLLGSMPFSDLRGEALAQLSPHILQQGPEAARNWIMGIQDERLQNGAMMRMAEPMAEVDPKGTAEWLMQHPGEAANRRMDDVYQAWAEKNQTAALASMSALPEGETRTNALRGVVNQAASTNPQSGLALMDKYPADVTDNVVRDFVRSSFDSDPAIAINAISRMADENGRNRTYEQLLVSWLEREPAKAQTWMSANPVPPNVAQRIQARMQRAQ
jgi:hypothetical protein